MCLKECMLNENASNLEYNRDPLIVDPETSVKECIQRLRDRKRGCVLVCENGNLAGIFTERDVLLKIINEHRRQDLPVKDFMTSNPTTVQASDSIAAVLKKMRQGGHRHVPMMGDDGVILGVVSIKHIVHFLVEHFPSEIYNLPPDPDKVMEKPEGA